MMDVTQECINWNSARYDRVSNASLSIALLEEEIDELDRAKDLLHIMDACGDIIFVCIGALWKLGLDKDEIDDLLTHSKKFLQKRKKVCCSEDGGKTNELFYLIYCAFFIVVKDTLLKYKLTSNLHAICEAVCKSNNTKSVEDKTDPSVKANKDKGPNYIPPTKDLLNIINNMRVQ